jgi:polyhydroxyalkanoate synthesis regulator phasin
MSISDDFRKLVMAGLGAASLAAEKTGEAVEKLARRGEETLAQGKDINERLRHEIRDTLDENRPSVPAGGDEVLSALDRLSPEELKAVREKLNRMGGGPGENG